MQAQFHHHKDGGKSKFQKGKENWKVKQENKGDSYKKQNSDTNHGDSSNQKKGREKRSHLTKGRFSVINVPNLATLLMSVEVAKEGSTNQMMRHMLQKMMA